MALTYTHIGHVNGNANPAVKSSFSPAAGGVLIMGVVSQALSDTFTIGGTLTGTWNEIAGLRHNTAGDSRTYSTFWCSNYGASGTVTVTATNGTWCLINGLTLVAEAGVLNTSDPIKQYKKLATGTMTTPVSLAWDTTPVYGTWFSAGPGNPPTAGSGYTQMAAADFSWGGCWSCKSATGADPMAFTVTSGNSNGLMGVEFKKISLGNHLNGSLVKTGWRR